MLEGRRLEAIGHVENPDPSEVPRRDGREQSEADVQRFRDESERQRNEILTAARNEARQPGLRAGTSTAHAVPGDRIATRSRRPHPMDTPW